MPLLDLLDCSIMGRMQTGGAAQTALDVSHASAIALGGIQLCVLQADSFCDSESTVWDIPQVCQLLSAANFKRFSQQDG